MQVSQNQSENVNMAQPFTYTGYQKDSVANTYYAQAREYRAEMGRFASKDVDEYMDFCELITLNQYIYCKANPVHYIDPTGFDTDDVSSDFLKVAGNAIADFFKNTFGAGATVVQRTLDKSKELIPWWLPLLVTTGSYNSTTILSKGDSSKPISVYAQGRSDKWWLSSVGIKLNDSNGTLTISVGADNIAVSESYKQGDKSHSVSVKVDLSKLKVGVEVATTEKVTANTNKTAYTNVSLNALPIAVVVVVVVSIYMGQPEAVGQYAY